MAEDLTEHTGTEQAIKNTEQALQNTEQSFFLKSVFTPFAEALTEQFNMLKNVLFLQNAHQLPVLCH